MEFPEAQDEHRWLQKLVGEWRYEMEAAMEPGKPLQKYTGTEKVRSLGDLWVLCEGTGDTPVGTAQSLMTLGYDIGEKRFVGTFIASMMSFLWIYEKGVLDPTGKMLMLDADGPSMKGDGSLVRYRDIIEFKNDDYRLLRAQVRNDDGQWEEFMESSYRRVT